MPCTFRQRVKDLMIFLMRSGDVNIYVKEIKLNGKKLKSPFVSPGEVVKGGKLVLHMSETPINNCAKSKQ